MATVTVIMYHFVGALPHARFPRLKGLPIGLFKKQLGYILNYYTVITMEDLAAALKGAKTLPHNALLLTFDDGYRDHFTCVFPLLTEQGIQGSFFPPGRAVEEHTLLAAHKIQLILASVEQPAFLLHDIYSLMDTHRKEYGLASPEEYYARLAKKDHLDAAAVVFIKHVLQYALPEKLRNLIIEHLFFTYVGVDEALLAKEFYMTRDQLTYMRTRGMCIGSHGWNHYWLTTLSEREQERDIQSSLTFLKQIGSDTSEWVFCYPYGAYTDSLRALVSRYGCTAAFTAETRIANVESDNPLALPRLDANDLPTDEHAAPNQWTARVLR